MADAVPAPAELPAVIEVSAAPETKVVVAGPTRAPGEGKGNRFTIEDLMPRRHRAARRVTVQISVTKSDQCVGQVPTRFLAAGVHRLLTRSAYTGDEQVQGCRRRRRSVT